MPEIFVLSGLGSSVVSYFRKGTDEIDRILDEMTGNQSETLVWNKWEDVVEAIKGKDPKKVIIIFVGHSNGVYGCMSAARELGLLGFVVHYIAAIDPTLKPFPKAGANILHIDEFHASSGGVSFVRGLFKIVRLWTGRIKKSPDFQGTHKIKKIRGGHVGIVSDPKLQSIIKNKVSEILADNSH